MKNLLILMSFLFVTVCYAAPPPDVGYVPAVDETEMLQVVGSYEAPVFEEVVIEVREVAFIDIGCTELYAGMDLMFEPGSKLEFAEMPVL